MTSGDYNVSFFHRSVAGFVIQGGGFKFANGQPVTIQSRGPVKNEYSLSNLRGTLAMAKLGDDPNSATNQWFFNLSNDNAANLNNQNGGFTVFGQVANNTSLTIMDRIAAVPVFNAGSPYDSIPLRNFTGGNITESNLVMVNSISVLGPTITANGVVSATAFGGGRSAAPGSFIEIYGARFAGATRGWTADDFKDGIAPTSLEGVTVKINGEPAFVTYVSPTQINVQVPSTAPPGEQVPVVVSYNDTTSDPVMLQIKTTSGGLLAPASFKVGTKQYVAAVHATTGAFVSNGQVPSVPAAPAIAGEVLTFYGTGFGAVHPGFSAMAGQIAQGQTTVAYPVEFYFGDLRAEISYAGLVPDLVGLYQFNVTVPAGLTPGDVPLRVTANGENIAQTLLLPVAN